MASPLPVRNLGRTGLALSEIGFGAGALGGFYGPVDHDTAIATVRTAYALGIRYFDVAPLYGHGRAELLLGHALREMPRDDFVLSSKVGRYFVPPGKDVESIRPGGLPFRPVVDYSREGTLRSLEQSFVRLGLTRLDIALIHDVDEHAHGTSAAAEVAFAAALAGAYPALLELKRAGDIKAIGIGVNQVPWALRFMREAELDCIMIAGRLHAAQSRGRARAVSRMSAPRHRRARCRCVQWRPVGARCGRGGALQLSAGARRDPRTLGAAAVARC
jgi:D-threo-aldose 1-dehydrogenase